MALCCLLTKYTAANMKSADITLVADNWSLCATIATTDANTGCR